VLGSPWTNSTGRAPRSWSRFISSRTFARYVVFAGDHGVFSDSPNSSFRATIGVAHAVEADAPWNSSSAVASIDAGSFGSAG
jgi:hypothetical protein